VARAERAGRGRSGAYLAPLRLLALEGQEEIEKRGRTASFITGEERDIREDARSSHRPSR
jgi:ATP-dependent RNA helicase SUPV3L1/SUV3